MQTCAKHENDYTSETTFDLNRFTVTLFKIAADERVMTYTKIKIPSIHEVQIYVTRQAIESYIGNNLDKNEVIVRAIVTPMSMTDRGTQGSILY